MLFIQFDIFIESILNQSIQLTPKNLYNFYFLATLFGQGKIQGDYGLHVTREFINNLQTKYLNLFSQLLIDQIDKYVRRGRISKEFDMKEFESIKKGNLDHKKIYELMCQTFRSDMKRVNDVWNLLAEYVYKLFIAQSIKDKFFLIDRINNCVHNTNEIIFTKFKNATELMTAYDIIHHANSLNQYKQYVDKDYREIENN